MKFYKVIRLTLRDGRIYCLIVVYVFYVPKNRRIDQIISAFAQRRIVIFRIIVVENLWQKIILTRLVPRNPSAVPRSYVLLL